MLSARLLPLPRSATAGTAARLVGPQGPAARWLPRRPDSDWRVLGARPHSHSPPARPHDPGWHPAGALAVGWEWASQWVLRRGSAAPLGWWPDAEAAGQAGWAGEAHLLEPGSG